MVVDSHAHLTLPQFDKDRRTVIERARKTGLEHIITVGLGVEDCRKALMVAEEYDFISVAVGVHPHDTKTIDEKAYSVLKDLTSHEKVVAIGEIGLDFYRNLSPREIQVEHFRKQLHLAREVSLPVIIHDRDAHHEVVTILREEQAETIGGVIHCFSGDWSMAEACLDLGFYLSIPGTITFRDSGPYQDLVKKLPLNRLLVETDCPFLTPRPFRGKRNEPAHVCYVAQTLARLKQMDVSEVAEITTHNAQKIFNIVLPY
ncbi:MAG: TatD family hydrolase [Deltaproteobacteria bacterium]|nr:TatD family hydrolase [Deltaproteobacteria bacterium]